MWSYVEAKEKARWLWHELDHHTGRVRADVVGTRKEAMFLKLKTLLVPFGITQYDTDKTSVYRRHLPPAQHPVGKLSLQKIERKRLTLRTRLKRLARKTLCSPCSRVMPTSSLGYKGPTSNLEHYSLNYSIRKSRGHGSAVALHRAGPK